VGLGLLRLADEPEEAAEIVIANSRRHW